MVKLNFQAFAFGIISWATIIAAMIWVGRLFPDEKVPRIDKLSNGARVYVIGSLGDEAATATGVILFVLLPVAYSLFVCRQLHARSDIDMSPRSHPVGCAIAGIVLVILSLIVVRGIIVGPYSSYYRVEVGPNDVVFSSLLRSWSVDKSEVNSARVVRKKKGGGPKGRDVQVRFIVTTRDEEEFRSVPVKSREPDRENMREYESLFGQLKADLVGGAKG
ncbi:MAG TPA: hypothetical protein DD670_15505 [Planctomycetaceae bacterium]|nr:hypothetical protein [Planctomycetaceae bacterium]